MTKGRFFVGLLILAGLGYVALWWADRWSADVSGKITGLELGLQHPVIGPYDLVKVDTDLKSRENPTGEAVLILTAKTEILEQNWWRKRTPVYDRELKPGQKVVANYSHLLKLQTLPPQQTVSEIIIVGQ